MRQNSMQSCKILLTVAFKALIACDLVNPIQQIIATASSSTDSVVLLPGTLRGSVKSAVRRQVVLSLSVHLDL